LQSAVLSFSAGPVAPADRIGSSDVALIMKACDASGRLLSPDKPATKSDASFIYQAFGASSSQSIQEQQQQQQQQEEEEQLPRGSAGADGQLWTTFATVNGSRYSYVLAPTLARNYSMSVTELGYNASTELLAVRELPTQSDDMVDIGADPAGSEAATLAVRPQNAAAGGTAGTMGGGGASRVAVVPVSASHPLEVRACTPDDFELVLLAPRHVLQPNPPHSVCKQCDLFGFENVALPRQALASNNQTVVAVLQTFGMAV
jgi:hypothetical protein